MALNLFTPIVTGLAGLGKAAATYNNAKKKTQPTVTTKTSTPAYNEHQQYIQDTHPGGYDAYVNLQNDRYNTALQDNDVDLLKRLQSDSQRVGYSLTPKQTQPVIPDYTQQMNDLLSAIQTYQNKTPDIPYPDIGDYNFGDIQKQLGNLTKDLQNYQGADYMNMDEAIARANSQLGGMYNQSLEQALEQYNKNAISRGMFGQMPVEALKQNAISESELNKANAINSLGANLHSQDFNMAQMENRNYYDQMNQLADLLSQQYNTELGQYQADVNKYSNLYNQSRQQDQDFFDNINRQLDILGTQYNLQNNEMDRYVQNIGQFSNDYMAEINKLTNDNDPLNDWKIAYLQNARNQKIAGMNEQEAKTQNETYKQAMDMFGKLGYASGWIAQALGLPEGTTTATYARLNSGGGSSGGRGSSNSGGVESTEPTLEGLTPTQAQNYLKYARESLAQEKGTIELNPMTKMPEFVPYNPTQEEVLDRYSTLLKALGFDNSAVSNYLREAKNIPSRSPDTNAGLSDEELFNLIVGELGKNNLPPPYSWKDNVPKSNIWNLIP